MDGIKTIYKARYVIDIEIKEERSENGRMVKVCVPEMEVKQEVVIRDINPLFSEDSEKYDYLEKHFPAEIEHLYARMLGLETFALDRFSPDIDSKVRKQVISHTSRLVDKDLRKRLATKKGRKPDKAKNDYIYKKKQFTSDCVEILKKMRNEGEKINQQNFADKYFTDKYRENQVKPLLQKLKLYEISWKELLAKIPNNLT